MAELITDARIDYLANEYFRRGLSLQGIEFNHVVNNPAWYGMTVTKIIFEKETKHERYRRNTRKNVA